MLGRTLKPTNMTTKERFSERFGNMQIVGDRKFKEFLPDTFDDLLAFVESEKAIQREEDKQKIWSEPYPNTPEGEMYRRAILALLTPNHND